MAQEKPKNKEPDAVMPRALAPRRAGRMAGGEAVTSAQLAAEIEYLREQLRSSQTQIELLEKSAHEDPLTGLLNRRGFERAFIPALAYLKRYGGSAALLYLDLDGFKPVNDRHGHGAGDMMLQEVARLLLSRIRASDIAARLGGDEFALVLWNLDAKQIEAKARALEAVIDQASFEVQGEKLALGISIGGVMLAPDDTLATALERADAAMYARKRERKETSPG